MKLKDQQVKAISEAVDKLFYSTKYQLLGRFFKGPSIYFTTEDQPDPNKTLEGLFRYSFEIMFPGSKYDKKVVQTLADITGNYIDARRLQTKNQILTDIMAAKTKKEADRAITDRMKEATNYVDMLVNNESRVVQSYAEKQGIHQVAASVGVDDPVVCKLGIIDDKMCKNCRKLWHVPHNVRVPKVYKMSELQEGYNKDSKNPVATVGPTHPHCRHIMTFVPPNFGFDRAGNITFKGLGWDEWDHQRDGLALKSEPNQPLEDNFFELHDDHCDHQNT